jgi:hypothetical protein
LLLNPETESAEFRHWSAHRWLKPARSTVNDVRGPVKPWTLEHHDGIRRQQIRQVGPLISFQLREVAPLFGLELLRGTVGVVRAEARHDVPMVLLQPLDPFHFL